MGATSMRLLLDHIEGRRENDQIVNKIIKTNLVVRETTR
jgi:LacI family transcriptional regulator